MIKLANDIARRINSDPSAGGPLKVIFVTHHNTSKAALVMFSKCLSNELSPNNIRVNAVNPGLVLTPDWVKTATQLTEGTEQTAEQYLDKIAKDNAPIGRFGTPEEIANFFVFLCSPLASYSVGSTYFVDGGWLNVVA